MAPKAAKAPKAAATFAPWTATAAATAEHHDLDPNDGLTASQVAASRAKHGFNELDKEEGKPLWKMVLEQFDDALVKARPRVQPPPAAHAAATVPAPRRRPPACQIGADRIGHHVAADRMGPGARGGGYRLAGATPCSVLREETHYAPVEPYISPRHHSVARCAELPSCLNLI